MNSKKVEGYAEIQIRDSNGFLVSFVKTNPGQMRILEHPEVENRIQQWEIVDTFSRGDKNFEVRKFTHSQRIPTDSVWGNTGFTSSLNPYYFVVSAAHWGYPVAFGDTIIVTWTITLPAE
jgi:hypothetical protein